MELLDELEAYRTTRTTPPVPAALSAVLAVLGHDGDHVGSVEIDRVQGVCYVTVEWSVRCCEQSQDYSIPLSVLTDENVEHAAKVWVAECEIVKAQRDLDEKKDDLRFARGRLNKAIAKLAELQVAVREASMKSPD